MDGHGNAGEDGLPPALELRILGPLEAWLGDKQVALGGQRQRSVLACLLLEAGRAVSSDRIADAVWDGRPPAGVQTTLQTYVFHLRDALEPTRVKGAASGVISTVPGGYRLEVAAVTIDALRFEELVANARSSVATDPAWAAEQLKTALGLWRGDVLSDLASMDGFVAPVAGRLDEQRGAATELWVEAEMALGHEVLGTLDDIVARYPLREHLAAVRMLALYRAGRQADALTAYRTLRQTLDDELGIQPSAEVESLHQRVLQQDPGLDLVLPEAPDGTVATSPPPEPASAAGIRPFGLRWRGGTSRRRQWVAVSVVGALAASLLGVVVIRALRSDDITPVPPHTLAMLSDRGLDGDPVPVAGAVALASGAGWLWAANEKDDALVRIDPESRRVMQTIPGVGGSPQSVAVAGNDVWVAGSDEGVVTRVNATTDRIVVKIPVGVLPAAVAATTDQVWVANSADNTVQRIDPATQKAQDPIAVGSGPAGLLLDGRTLWVANSRSGSVSRLDVDSGERIAEDVRVDVGARGMAMTDTDVWVANELSQSVSRIDRVSGAVKTIPVEDGPSTVVVAEGSAWVSNAYSGSVSRIDVASNHVSRIALESAPRALHVVDGRVWVATGAFGNPEHLGGTLVVTGLPSGVNTLDPAGVYSVAEVSLLRHVYDGLVSFRVTGGQAAQALVADLATLVPQPTDGGRTYVFTIRAGVRYSTGAEVQAGDFVLGFRRALLNERGSPATFDKVVGAASCLAAREFTEHCNLEGVTADDTTRRLTVRLSEPDPDFLAKLALFVVPAPPGSPLRDVGMNVTIPGTGPYYVSEIRPDGLTLSRNPHFNQWSFAAQPYAYPDQIRTQTAASSDLALADVLAGRADVFYLNLEDLPKVAGRVDQLHQFRILNTDWAYLNRRIPPFDNVKVRQALNYAVDRRKFVTLYGGGPSGATISCQLLPPGFPAWRPYCPYQTGRHDEPYLGPDLARAQQLVRESGTALTPVTVHAFRGYPLWNAFPAYLADVLRSIGYADVKVTDIPPEHNAGFAADPAYAGYQIFTQQGWVADYPSASNFYSLFSCHEANLSGYCNPAIEAVAVQATAAAPNDPTRSLDLWTQVDEMLTDDAAFVTLGNHQGAVLVSERVGNVQTRSGVGVVLSQLWVR